MLGILVCGSNHFIVCGPLPNRDTSLALACHWSIIQIGRKTPEALRAWRIVTRAFREDLEWAVVVPALTTGKSGSAPGPAIEEDILNPQVPQLLSELAERGILVRNSLFHNW